EPPEAAAGRGGRGALRRGCREDTSLIRGRAIRGQFRTAAIGGRLGLFAPRRSRAGAPIPGGGGGTARAPRGALARRWGRNGLAPGRTFGCRRSPSGPL